MWETAGESFAYLVEEVSQPVRVEKPGDYGGGHPRRVLFRLQSGNWHHSPESAIRRSTWIPCIPGSWTLRLSSITSSALNTWLKT